MKALEELRTKDDTHLIRPANTLDPFSAIGTILYDAHPEVFIPWFNGNRERGVNVLTYLCSEPRSFFSYEHMVVVENVRTHELVGIANIFDSHTRLDYNYSYTRNHDWRTDQAVKNYIGGWTKNAKQYDDTTLFLPNLSGPHGGRNQVASVNKLMSAIIQWARHRGYAKIVTECCSDNTPIVEFFRAHGFARISADQRSYVDGHRDARISTMIRSTYV